MDAQHPSDEPVSLYPPDRDVDHEARLQRQYDVYAAAKATLARHHLREVRQLALRGQYSYHDIRRARRDYRRAKAVAPTVWHFGPNTENDANDAGALKAA